MRVPPTEKHPRPTAKAVAARPAFVVAILIAFVTSGCASNPVGSVSDAPNIVDAGQIGQIQLPDDDPPAPAPAATATDDTATDDTATDDTATDDTATDDTATDDTAIPLADDDRPAILGLIDAFDDFTTCFEREGFEFSGVPGQDGPVEDFPAGYSAALGSCAASTNVVQAIQDSAAENAELTPEQIEDRNEAYFVFEDCLKGLGWTPAPAVPDEYGVLGPEGGDFGLPNNLDDPIGPVRECAAVAAAPLLEQAEES